MDGRLVRRLVGLLRTRTAEVRFSDVTEVRNARGLRWPLESLLGAVFVGLCAGCKGLAEVESLSGKLAPGLRAGFHVTRRIPDTTMREVLVKLAPEDLRERLRTGMKAAQRRKSLEPTEFPMGVVVLDGKVVVTPKWDDKFAQRHTSAGGKEAHGEVRLVTACLVSCRAKPCLDASHVPAGTNEMAHFTTALDDLVAGYGKGLFEMVMYDAGATSLANANAVVGHNLAYGFALKENQPTLLAEAKRLLGSLPDNQAVAETVDKVGSNKIVTRRLFITEEMAGFMDWDHLRTTVRVQSVTEQDGRETAREDRYIIFNLPKARFSGANWLKLVRLHWGVENNCHNTWDKILREDERPFIHEPQGLVVVALLRRLAYNALSLFRSVTQRSEAKRAKPWKELLQDIRDALVSALPQHVEGLRRRVAAPRA